MFVEELERHRKAMGLTQDELAARLNMSPRAYRSYVCGERQMPPQVQDWIAARLKSPLLAALVLAQFEGNPFAPAVLDVDDHPAQELCAALNELREALEAIESVDVCRPDKARIERAMGQMLDLLHLIPLAAGSWARAYGIDLWEVKRRNLNKLRLRGYLGKEAAA